MTFEKKTLVSMAIEGPLDRAKIPFLSPNLGVFPIGPNQNVLLYGVQTRQENDTEEALSQALVLRSPNLKIFISTESVLFEDQLPQLSWIEKWNHTFSLLDKGEVAVSLDLVRIYQRIFDIRAKRVKKESIFILEEKKANPSRIRGLQKKYSPLVGRKKELSTMLEIVEQSFEDQGQIASLVGDAGLGKTRLKFEFTETLKKMGIPFYEGYFSLNSDLNFRGFHQLAQQLLEPNTETFSKWDLNDFESAFLRFFLRPDEKSSIVKDLNEEELTQGIFHSIQKLFTNAGQKPLVLILDDFHWAGDKSVQLMDILSQRLEKTKIAFFLLHRPTYKPTFLKRLNYHQIKLSALEHEETKTLVKNALHLNYITDGAVETLNNLSLGNPLYVEEVLRELISQKQLDIQKNEDVLRLIQVQFPEGVIPTNLQSLITARLDLLTAKTKETLQWVCAFGFRENHDDFELFLQTQGLTVETFQSLFDQEYLEEASMFPEHKYKFSHDLLYETIKQSIPESDWVEKNQTIAEFLQNLYQHEMIIQGDRIADFYIKGKMKESSFNPLFEAASIALAQKRYSSAVKYFDECYKLFLQYTNLIDASLLYDPYLEALFASGEKDKTKKIIQNWQHHNFSSPENEIKYLKKHLEYLYKYRELELLSQISKKAIHKFTDKKYENDLLIFKMRYFQALTFQFKSQEAIHLGFLLLRKTNNTSHMDDLKIEIYFGIVFLIQQTGSLNVGSYLTLIANDIASRSGSFKQKIMIQRRVAHLFVAQGYYKEALRIWSDLINMSRQHGYVNDIFVFQGNVILNQYFLGNYADAFEGLKNFENIDRYDWNKKFIYNWIGLGYLAVGAFEKVRQLIASQRYSPTRDPYVRGNLLYLTANYHFQRSEFKKAERFYRYAKTFYQKIDQKIFMSQMNLYEICCKLKQGTISAAAATVEFNLSISHERMTKYFYEWNTQMLSFFFARHGCDTRFKPSEDYDPMKCNAVYLRMQMFVEKIKWLKHIGKNDAAKKLNEQYLKHRQEMAFYVPDEFKKSFLENPFYQV